MKRLLCFFGYHEWGPRIHPINAKQRAYFVCKRCDKIEREW
jgi:hypothetical protein